MDNGIQKIKNKITNDAEAQADAILKEAQAEISEINKKSNKELKNYEKHYTENTNTQVEMLKHKTLSKSRLKAKNDFLKKREEIIEDFIKKGVKEIDFKGKDYIDFLKKTIEKNKKTLSGKVEIICNKRDKSKVKDLSSDLDCSITEEDITGGIILIDSEKKRVDASLSAVLEDKRDNIRQKIARKL